MDLRALREQVMAARANPQPRDEETQRLADGQRLARERGFVEGGVVVTPDGVITTADRVDEQTPVSRVTSEIFAAPAGADTAQRYLPPGHQPLKYEGFDGWIYDVTTRGGRTFTFFLYWDRFDGCYEVVLISPAYEEAGLSHEMHIFPSGRLCLSGGGPITDLQNAYGRSVMWADGVCQMLDGHSWPWGESDDEYDYEDELDDECADSEDDFESGAGEDVEESEGSFARLRLAYDVPQFTLNIRRGR